MATAGRWTSRSASRPAWIALSVSVAIWLAALQPWHWYMGDLVVYRGGALALLHHRGLYTVVSGRHHLHFTYPPFAAVLLAPLALMPLAAAKLVLTLATFGCLSVVVTVCLRGQPGGGVGDDRTWLPAILAVAIWLEPVRATFDFGQINAVVLVLVVLDVLALAGGRGAGSLIGVAAAMKLTPLAFIPYLFAIGRRRAAATASAVFVGCAAIGAAADPRASWTYWTDRIVHQTDHVGRVENASNQSIRGVLARLLRTQTVPGWWLAIAVAVFVAGLAAAVVIYRAGQPVWSVAAMGITTLAVSPVSWSHHWIWCVVMVPAVIDVVRRRPGWRTAATAGFVLVPFAAGLVFLAPHTDHRELTDNVGQQILSASYLIAGALLVAMLLRAVRGPQLTEASISSVSPHSRSADWESRAYQA
jgi:alpha-1,2-mannosyltransferase